MEQQTAQKKAIMKGKILENGAAVGQAEYDSFSRQNDADRTEIYSRQVRMTDSDSDNPPCVSLCVALLCFCVCCNTS